MQGKIYLQAKYLSFSSGTKAARKPRYFSLTSNETTQNFLRSVILFLKTFEIPINPNYINSAVCNTVKEMLYIDYNDIKTKIKNKSDLKNKNYLYLPCGCRGVTDMQLGDSYATFSFYWWSIQSHIWIPLSVLPTTALRPGVSSSSFIRKNAAKFTSMVMHP